MTHLRRLNSAISLSHHHHQVLIYGGQNLYSRQIYADLTVVPVDWMMSRAGLGPNSSAAAAAANLAYSVVGSKTVGKTVGGGVGGGGTQQKEHISARILETSGDHPGARAFHSATLVGNFVVV
jgi:hypothetical protein